MRVPSLPGLHTQGDTHALAQFAGEEGVEACVVARLGVGGFGDVEEPKAEISKLGVKVDYHGADMSKPAEIEAIRSYGVDVIMA